MADAYPSAEVVGTDLTYGFPLFVHTTPIEPLANRRLVPSSRSGQQSIQPVCGTQGLC